HVRPSADVSQLSASAGFGSKFPGSRRTRLAWIVLTTLLSAVDDDLMGLSVPGFAMIGNVTMFFALLTALPPAVVLAPGAFVACTLLVVLVVAGADGEDPQAASTAP